MQAKLKFCEAKSVDEMKQLADHFFGISFIYDNNLVCLSSLRVLTV